MDKFLLAHPPIFRSYNIRAQELTLNKSILNISQPDSAFAKLKKDLTAAKFQYDKYANNENFALVQNATDAYSDLRTMLRKFGAQNVTNAWLKYYEIFTHFNIADYFGKNSSVFAFCNAELPGASICALNHYAYRKFGLSWVAASLIDDESGGTALGDKYGIYKYNRKHWLMNNTNNGDATKIENILAYEVDIGARCDLYSHDAGVDVSDGKYDKQEELNARVHLGCALAGFVTLKPKTRNYPGGVFIAKQYSFFEPLTYSLILIYARLFDKFMIVKPKTSRPRNSEVYLIGLGFLGLPKDIRELLFDKLENFNMTPVIDISTVDLSDLKAAGEIVTEQIAYIDNGIKFHKQLAGASKSEIETACKIPKTYIDNWIKDMKIVKLPDFAAIPDNRHVPKII